ncbi:MAG: tRNA preQ1(34) S-adenosylmethionine ribosyltransferase-isomerase QueA [Bacillota bacterium]|nr:tRNA preQ1(34) S-adenosylmethionine ribosyltransferase-isomerase QueA [Bacillota bacterium]
MNKELKKKDFYYDLPEELIAQTPLEKRSNSKLMVLDRKKESIQHNYFFNLLDYLNEGDCLVINNTKVIPGRLYGQKSTGANIEILLLKEIDKYTWECLTKPAKRLKLGTEVVFSQDLKGEVVKDLEQGIKHIRFQYEGSFHNIIDIIGEMPLPPYIKEKLEEKNRYQTVYAKKTGSAAAPTAGLHFTDELLEKIKNKGIKIAYITLHVGLDTFRPVKVDNISEHKMHSEYYEIDRDNAELINSAKKRGNRVISVGTTSTRTLETIGKDTGYVESGYGWTDIFLYPGYKFKIVDGLITNFHLPESTLLMLVSAFATKDYIFKAYKEAIKEEYRFFSFGDAMFIY